MLAHRVLSQASRVGCDASIGGKVSQPTKLREGTDRQGTARSIVSSPVRSHEAIDISLRTLGSHTHHSRSRGLRTPRPPRFRTCIVADTRANIAYAKKTFRMPPGSVSRSDRKS